MKEITSVEEFNQVLESDVPVVADFWAEWCGPCKNLAPILEKVSETMSDDAVFVKISIDEVPELAKTYNIRSIPTIVILEGGKEAERIVGFKSESEMRESIQEALV